jgi:hypothetical protein
MFTNFIRSNAVEGRQAMIREHIRLAELFKSTTLRGKFTLRTCIGQRTTGEHHVRETWRLITSEASEL